MTDVYISCAAVDLDRVRSIVHGLRSEGWDVLCDPETAELTGDSEDPRSVSAGAVVVAWTAASRESAHVRAEASNALYKNKLIQVRLDDQTPPRPFDQVDSVDLGNWWGWPEDAGWRAVVGAVRLYAGPPGAAAERPQVLRKASVKSPTPSYLEPERVPGPATYAVAAAGVAVVVGAAAWLMLPGTWRTGGASSVASLPPSTSPAAVRTATTGEPAVATTLASTGSNPTVVGAAAPSTAASAAWAQVDRRNPSALRAFAAQYSGTDAAESAKALLRVLDAQQWVEAVSGDTEAGYRAYLAAFPPDSALPGVTSREAARRLSELGAERSQAITAVQQGLASAGLYKGAVDGKPGARTMIAAREFAESSGILAPELATAAPRDIRGFSDQVRARRLGGDAATPAAASLPAVPAPSVAATSTAQPAAVALTSTAGAPVVSEAEALASTQLLQAEEATWQKARGVNTPEAYKTYLSAFPRGRYVADARKLSAPPAFSVEALSPDLRSVVTGARQAQTRAQAKAAEARDAAERANAVAEAARNGVPGAKMLTAADGDQVESEVVGLQATGYGVRIEADAVSRGDVYRGQLRDGVGEGVGVYEFADNPNNASAGALRYEGEHAGDAATGAGVTVWKNGDRYAGEDARGVFTFADGRRYEGQLRNGARQGLGVVWSASGEPLMAGRWENGKLVEPMAPPR